MHRKHVYSLMISPFSQLFEMVELHGAPVDCGAVLDLLQLFELDNQGLDHRLGRVDFVVVSGFAQGSFDDVTYPRQ